MSSSRCAYLDAAKGIGILLVISGHLFQYGGKISSIIFGFHMPLFFFISGMLYKSEKIKTFGSFFVKKVKMLLVPYLIVYLVGGMVSWIVPKWRSGLSLSGIIAEFYYAQPESFHVGQIWFLVCIFNVELIFYFYHKYVIEKTSLLAQGLFLGTIAFAGTNIGLLNQYMPYGRLPIKLDTALIALVFYVLGYMLKDFINDESYIKNVLIALPVLILFVFYISWRYNGWVNICSLIFNNVFLYFFIALCGIFLVMLISKVVCGMRLLRFAGKNSLVIFTLHSLAIYLYAAILSVKNKVEMINGNNMTPKQAVVGTVFVTLIMLVIAYGYNTIKKGFRNRGNS